MKMLTREEFLDQDLTPEMIKTFDRWLDRGDGVAVYENHDLGHPEMGDKKFVSYGGNEALLEGEIPPQTLPDIGTSINWRYQLVGVYHGAPLAEACDA